MTFRAIGHGRKVVTNRGGNIELLEEIRRVRTRMEAPKEN